MGRLDFRPQRVRQTATILLANKRQPTPPWYDAMGDIPPPEILTRTLPVQHRAPKPVGRRKIRKPSKMFIPQTVSYAEDKLRSEFFKDHPWELSRPRVLLEDDGKDYQRWDWSKSFQIGRPIGGESVVQRQRYLMQEKAKTLTEEKLDALGEGASQREKERASDAAVDQAKDEAYDQARRELYDMRHDQQVEQRIAREEAMAVGGYFGLSQNEIGMGLENKTFDHWREWAEGQVVIMEQAKSAAYTGGGGSQGGTTTKDDGVESVEGEQSSAVTEEVERNVPGSKQSQQALGGAATHP